MSGPGIDDLKKLVAEHARYLQVSQQKFGKTPPGKLIPQAVHVLATDISYHPEPFYADLVARGGLVPIMLYNNITFTPECTAFSLDQKLEEWKTMKDAYLATLNNPDFFKDHYAQWKKKDPVFAGLTEDQRKALYCVERFRQKYFTSIVGSPLITAVGPLSDVQVLKGDCDSLSYLCTGLLIEAKDKNGAKVFDPHQFSFETFPEHMRLKIDVRGGDPIYFESTFPVHNASNKRTIDYNYTRNHIDPNALEATFSLAYVSLFQVYSDFPIPKEDERQLALIRTLMLIDHKDSLFNSLYADVSYSVLDAQIGVALDKVTSLSELNEQKKAIPNAKYATMFRELKQLKSELSELEIYCPSEAATTKTLIPLSHQMLDVGFRLMRASLPAKFDALTKAYEQADLLKEGAKMDPSSPPHSSVEKTQPSVPKKKANER